MTVAQWIGVLWPIFIAQLPLYIVWIVGMILALVFWRKHPRVSLLALLGFALLLAVSLVGTFFSAYWPISLRNQGMTGVEIGRIIGIANLAVGVAGAGAWVLIVIALFVGRPRT